LDAGAVLICVRHRRYEKELESWRILRGEAGATIVCSHDAMGIATSKTRTHCFRAMSRGFFRAWDSKLAINFLIEALVAEVHRAASTKAQSGLQRLNR